MSQEDKNNPSMKKPSPGDTTRPSSCDNVAIKTTDLANAEKLARRRPERDIYRPEKARKEMSLRPRLNDRPTGSEHYNDYRMNNNRFSTLNNPVGPSPHSSSGDYRSSYSYNVRGTQEAPINKIHNGSHHQSNNPVSNSNTRYNSTKNIVPSSGIQRVYNSSATEISRDMHSHQHQHFHLSGDNNMHTTEEHNKLLAHNKSRTETRIYNSRSLNPQAAHTSTEIKDQLSNTQNISQGYNRNLDHDSENKLQPSDLAGKQHSSRNTSRPEVTHHQQDHDHKKKSIDVSDQTTLSFGGKLNGAQPQMSKLNKEEQPVPPKAHSPHNRTSTLSEKSGKSNTLFEPGIHTNELSSNQSKQLTQTRTLTSGAVLGPVNAGTSQHCDSSRSLNKSLDTIRPPDGTPILRQNTNLDDLNRNPSRETKPLEDRDRGDWRKNPSDELDNRLQQRDSSYNRRNLSGRDNGRNYRDAKYQQQVAPRFRRIHDQGDRNPHFTRQLSRNNDSSNRRPPHNNGRVEQYLDSYPNQSNERHSLNNGGGSTHVYGNKPHVANNSSSGSNFFTHQIKDSISSSSRSSSVSSSEHFRKLSTDKRDSTQDSRAIHINPASDLSLNIEDIYKEIEHLHGGFSSYFATHKSRDNPVTGAKAIILQNLTKIESTYDKLFALPLNNLASNFVHLHNLWTNVHFRLIQTYEERLKVTPTPNYRQELLECLHFDHIIIYYDKLLIMLFKRLRLTMEDIMTYRYEVNNRSVESLEISSKYINHIHLCLGDLWNIKEEGINTVRSRAYYLKAQLIDPTIEDTYRKLGFSFQSINRKFEAVYFHMRYYAASNKLPDESFYQLTKQIARNSGKGTEDFMNERQIEELSLVDLNKLFNWSFIDIYSKLIDKASSPPVKTINQMLLVFKTLLKRTPTPFSSQRLLQIMSLNMFAASYCKSQESTTNEVLADELTFTMATMIIEASNSSLYNHFQSEEFVKFSLPVDLHEFLPAVKLWLDWISCPDRIDLINQPLSSEIGLCSTKPGHWPNYLADLYNLLSTSDLKDIFYGTRDKNRKLIWLIEDIQFVGFAPLGDLPRNSFYCEVNNINELSRNYLRVRRIIISINNLFESDIGASLFKNDSITGTSKPIMELCEAHPSVSRPKVWSEEATFESIRKRVLDKKLEFDALTDTKNSSSPTEYEEESSWVRLEMEAQSAKDEALSRSAIHNGC